ncbi:DUF294 nucleotidyltransferase-like domain-containing protein [Marinigracilibium pacificum]|uniref:Cyclic nucleotide-binding domain-containing protein n=1 Tax=Marinigracilibium pacificum TaxID=2729599 RepID=A0A848J110_9BACT|nr:DUF294 nucleotidyltransferase-like domain-containing protein [Marinigracilibium pacificum]NMM47979.1 cyclic nucleotide-binding domain-containing protein [Marinigracilibium pacificum]
MKPKNPAVLRVAEFMSGFAPFSLISKEEVEEIAFHTEILYFKKDTYLFKKGDPATNLLYLVEKGSVNIYSSEDDLSDTCAEGDIFGVRSVLSGNNFVLSAKTIEESFIYAIPGDLINQELNQNAQWAAFFASGLAGGQTIIRDVVNNPHSNNFSELKNIKPSHLFRIEDLLELKVKIKLVSVDKESSLKNVAELMINEKVGSVIIVDEKLIPIGIITDNDFRKVIANNISYDTKVKEVMTSPVIKAGSNQMVSELQQIMLEKGVHHIAITKTNAHDSPVITVVSHKDLMLFEGDKPDILLRNIKIVETLDQLKNLSSRVSEISRNYIQADFPIEQVSKIITTLNDELTKKAITLALNQTENIPDSNKWCWFALGSMGRSEQIIKTDQDNALIYDNSLNQSEISNLLELAKAAVDNLNAIGFDYCPAEMMASNPKWNNSESKWNEIFSSWITTPVPDALMHSTIFFDFRPILGNHKLLESIYDSTNKLISKHESFLNHLAGNALQNPPPLSFFRKFIVEKSGEHKELFDIKARALMPLADAARVFAYSSVNNNATNTIERFKVAAGEDVKNSKLLNGGAEAYEFLLKLRAKFGALNKDNGRFINPDSLNQFEKNALKDCFKIIGEIQKILEIRFNLGFLAK